MREKSFRKPVVILAGLGLPTNVSSAMEAHQVLNEWPVQNRDSSHRVASNACRGALKGEIEAETAR